MSSAFATALILAVCTSTSTQEEVWVDDGPDLFGQLERLVENQRRRATTEAATPHRPDESNDLFSQLQQAAEDQGGGSSTQVAVDSADPHVPPAYQDELSLTQFEMVPPSEPIGITEGCQTCTGGGSCHRCNAATCSNARSCWRSSCDMFQHHAYYPIDHGYYYFRPYNYMNVLCHVNLATTLGEDPRHPYANRLFERVYGELDEAGDAELLPLTSPDEHSIWRVR